LLDGATAWLNTEPLSPEKLKGHVVLVDFWTLTCINWLRTEPYIRSWARAYRDAGLVVLGVHTPEFSFEHDIDRVRQAIVRRDIDYPVAVDNAYGVWTAFDNHYWPALYFVDRDGVIRDEHFGEGRYEGSERTIQKLLGIEREPVSVTGAGIEAPADWSNLRTPETYVGRDRGGGPVTAGRLRLNHWSVTGKWAVESDRVVLEEARGEIAFRFHARDAHVVLSRGGEPVPFRVRLDGEPPGASRGEDIDTDGAGLLDEGRLYQLIRQAGPVQERTVEITFDAPGADIYSFTFG
jgi:thiol-disulfide isomerase/thioredoxin